MQIVADKFIVEDFETVNVTDKLNFAIDQLHPL